MHDKPSRPDRRQMRPVTPEEAELWTALAREHGYADEDGNIHSFGHFALAGSGIRELPGGVWEIRVLTVTPILASRLTDDLQEKEPPITFDRTEAGELIIPGRWIASMFEHLRDDPGTDEEIAALAATLVAGTGEDTLLPPETGHDRAPRAATGRWPAAHIRGAPARRRNRVPRHLRTRGKALRGLRPRGQLVERTRG